MPSMVDESGTYAELRRGVTAHQNGVPYSGLITQAPPFVITGTGRSGTTHISNLLRKLNIHCGHENWFTPYTLRQRFGLDGDASWMVAPLLDVYKGRKLLQLRDPLKVIGSYVGINGGQFMRGDTPIDGDMRLFWELHLITLPRLVFSKDPIYNATAWWVEINNHILDHCDFWWRIEDLDATLLKEICTQAGWPNISLDECEKAITATAPSHPSPQKAARVTWGELPASLLPAVIDLCERVGYEHP